MTMSASTEFEMKRMPVDCETLRFPLSQPVRIDLPSYPSPDRKTTYRLLSKGTLQVDDPALDMGTAIIYQDEKSGDVLIRPEAEFFDGTIAPKSSGEINFPSFHRDDFVDVIDFLPRFKHQKRGTRYMLLSNGFLETTAGRTHVVVYIDINDSSVWVRPVKDFFDGRFKRDIAPV